MDIIRNRQETRAIKIHQIEASIKSNKKKELDIKKLTIATMANLNLSRPTAREYIEIALYNLGLSEE